MSLIAAMALTTGCQDRQPMNEPDPNIGAPIDGEINAAATAKSEKAVDDPDGTAEAGTDSDAISACLMQGDDRLQVQPIRAVGTEPFWAARIEGRCVTYSTPEDQEGIRVWTRYSAGPSRGGSWIGQLGGKPFEMRIQPEPGCSDGMSDKAYPIAVELTVNGEQRRGCAEPL